MPCNAFFMPPICTSFGNPFKYCIIISSLATSEINKTSFLEDFGYKYRHFCPEAFYCNGNTRHTICKHDPSKPLLTPRDQCIEPVVGVTLSKSHINLLLQAINIIRVDTMDPTKTVPPAKALFEIQWNDGLALVAQIHANGCKYERDECRYTYNFLNPDIIMAKMKFLYPNWGVIGQYVSYEDGLTNDKIVFFLQNILKHWIVMGKQAIDEIKFTGILPPRGSMSNAGYVYLKLISQHLTHIGCGISGFKNVTDNKATFYAMLICNLSKAPDVGDLIYSTDDHNDCPAGHPIINDLCSDPVLPTIPPILNTTVTTVTTTTPVPTTTTVATTTPVLTTTTVTNTTTIQTTTLDPDTTTVLTTTTKSHCVLIHRFIYIPIIIVDDRSGKLLPIFQQKIDLRDNKNSESEDVDVYRRDNQKGNYNLNVKDSVVVSRGQQTKATAKKGPKVGDGSIVNKVKIEVPVKFIWKTNHERMETKTELLD